MSQNRIRSFIRIPLGTAAAILFAAAAVIPLWHGIAVSDPPIPLDVAYAGSMGPLMNGPIKAAAASTLGIDMRGHGQGAMGLARLIEAGSLKPDVFISVTPGPMRVVIAAHKATTGVPIASTEMVIAYSPKGRFAAQFTAASSGASDTEPWWQILETPGVRFGRTDPKTDPQGLNILFVINLAEKFYQQPGLGTKILGPTINPKQIFQEPEVMARLQAGQIDASSAYGTQPDAFKIPYIKLPKEINLGDAALEKEYAKVSVTLDGKTLHPAPLIFYAAVLTGSTHKGAATRFVQWLQGPDAQKIFAANQYDPPGDSTPLTAK